MRTGEAGEVTGDADNNSEKLTLIDFNILENKHSDTLKISICCADCCFHHPNSQTKK